MQLNLSVEARTANGAPLDRVKARNSVIEPLEEASDVDCARGVARIAAP